MKNIEAEIISEIKNSPIKNGRLTAKVEHFEEYLQALQEISPVPVRFWRLTNKNGCYYPVEKLIVIRMGMSQAQTIKTLVHEIAHAKLHALSEKDWQEDDAVNEALREIQAESVAYVVCRRMGIYTFSFSFPYMEQWIKGKNFEELAALADVALRTADEIVNDVEKCRNKEFPAAGI